jgi:hypothetical protein
MFSFGGNDSFGTSAGDEMKISSAAASDPAALHYFDIAKCACNRCGN